MTSPALLSSFSLLTPEDGSILASSTQPLPPLVITAGATSFEGQRRGGGSGSSTAAPTHVTFRAKVKSSGYGSTTTIKPAWAIAKAVRAARGSTKSDTGGSTVADGSVSPHISHPSPTPELVREDREVFGPAPTSSITLASTSAFPGGPVACLSFSSIGDALCVGAHAGDFFTCSLDVDYTTNTRAPRLCAGTTSRRTGLQGRALSCSFSTGTFARTTSGLRSNGGGNSGGGSSSERFFTPAEGGGNRVDFAVATAAARVRRVADTSSTGLRAAPPSRLLLGSGDDTAAYLWATGAGAATTPLLAIRSPTGGDAGGGSGSGTLFTERVSHAQFAYVDRLILLACGSRIFAMKFTLGDEEREGSEMYNGEDTTAARRRAASRRYKLVASWAATDGTSVVALTAPNTFRSPLVFAAFSDRSVRVFDLSVAGGSSGSGGGGGGGGEGTPPPEVLRITDAHARSPHTLALPTASALCDVAEASLDCVLTAATDGCVRLWDVRTATCARSLTGAHTNRAGVVGAAISPCATFVGVGSECGRTAVYDLRTGEPVSRIAGARDVVTAVAWHPALPRLAVGSLDGGVRFFSPP
jgi:WD40 repeat protein